MLIAFDLTNSTSFDGVKRWIDSIYKHCDVTIPKVLIGNKVDLKDIREVSETGARKLAEEHHM